MLTTISSGGCKAARGEKIRWDFVFFTDDDVSGKPVTGSKAGPHYHSGGPMGCENFKTYSN